MDVSYIYDGNKQKVTNKEIRSIVGTMKKIVGIILELNLNLFGHICRMEDTRLVKNVVFGKIEGRSRRGRLNREWLDDIEEWCQEDNHSFSRKAQDRDLWRRTVNYAVNTDGP